ncbi:tetratricopeptide repeat protein [Pyxidicoccus parkwayensis]|uniref:Tetratricopeptide repeat protein n=1 Tax=Pyxidicoccus parkwayensis TaxID=2813578 RepID=A0ABX7P0T4_9BACT|nr:tetratricopeptide repeat protein [Pyxidicoccus parkwaysis]QSQ23296.1 tetratricopeptide repeat protein [Pyxidicoccus parkwaysis]
MTVVPALALVALVATTDTLAPAQQKLARNEVAEAKRVAQADTTDILASAQEAFARGDYAQAEQLAQEAARPPRLGAALYLVGLSRFRAGRPAEALEALDAAGLAEDAPEPALWNFNRGACLYALGRFEEAEQAFAAAASDATLARVAWLNAGFAALDAGALERAATWADRAASDASENEALQVEELRALITQARGQPVSNSDASYREGLAAFDAGRFDEARACFLRAAEQDPSSGRARLMAGASAWRTGDRAVAREDVTEAVSLPLDTADRHTAHQYLDRLSFGLRASGPGLRLYATAAGGFDSNVLQVGVAPRDVSGASSEVETASAFGEAGVGLAARLRLSDTLFAYLSYSGNQRIYTLESVRDYSLQLHRAAATFEWEAARHLRVGLSGGGDVFFTGLADFRGLQASVNGWGWLAVDESEHTSTRLDLTYARKSGLASEFDYLTGPRFDATLSQELRLKSQSVTAWYRYREDRIGTLVQETTADNTTGAARAYVIPFGWTGHAVGASARGVLGPVFDASLDAELERRNYLEDSSLRVTSVDGTEQEWNPRRRRDWRFTLGTAVSARLSRWMQVTARYELLVNRSNVDTRLEDEPGTCTAPDYVCHVYDYTNGNYEKHVLTLELGASW